MVYGHGDEPPHGHDFEVDSTESVWYTLRVRARQPQGILKLTPQSQYGITPGEVIDARRLF